VPTQDRVLVGTARKSAPLPTLQVAPVERNPLQASRRDASFFLKAKRLLLGCPLNFPPASECIHPRRIELWALAGRSVSVLFDLVRPQGVACGLALSSHVRICEEMYAPRLKAARGVARCQTTT
jgi:hypothetical protein